MELIGHRPEPVRPGLHDDRYIRSYRLMRLALEAAGDDTSKRKAVIRQYPDVWRAHQLHHSPDLMCRQIMEARLLTSETIAEIASRFDMSPAAVDYYEKLFFHVRDRLQSKDWINKIIKGPCRGDSGNRTGVTADD